MLGDTLLLLPLAHPDYSSCNVVHASQQTALFASLALQHAATCTDTNVMATPCPTLQEEFQRVQAELTDAQRRRAALEAQEHELEAQLNTHNSEYDSSRGDLADLEAMGRNRVSKLSTYTSSRVRAGTPLGHCG